MAVTQEARMDLAWLMSFLSSFNGVTMVKRQDAQQLVGVDACLLGAGAIWEGRQFYSMTFPDYWKEMELSINSWECFNLLMCRPISLKRIQINVP